MRVKVLGIQGNELRLAVDDDFNLDKVIRFSDGKQPSGELTIDDNRHISRDQQKKIFALIDDLCNYTGDEPKRWENEFKWRVQVTFGLDEFSLSNCSMTVGNYMILTILDFLFAENIPFRTKLWDSLPQDFPRQRLALKNRTCVICGRPHADLAHYKAVGMGRNRHKIDERKMYFMTLCREHHQEQHNIGIKEFMQKYHLKPLRLSDDDIIRFKILTKKRLEELKNA
ncbi:putative HNHc nuclease [Limosilactobacillus antri]|uniref:putative HNHc nuclease n=1 Tax=Limosilactobacillus antri TaxID=227943 RepID=UPI001F5649D8|nr:putative HNHc nuclease [Limosilactobacillus antri]